MFGKKITFVTGVRVVFRRVIRCYDLIAMKLTFRETCRGPVHVTSTAYRGCIHRDVREDIEQRAVFKEVGRGHSSSIIVDFVTGSRTGHLVDYIATPLYSFIWHCDCCRLLDEIPV